MVDIPDHLLERAQKARERLTGASSAGDSSSSAESSTESSATESDGAVLVGAGVGAGTSASASAGTTASDKIPAHLLDRTTPAGSAGAPVVTGSPTGAPVVAGGTDIAPSGPGGHTQRLLTVVKSGSIQDVKTLPVDKVHVWPHLLIVEFVAALAVTAFLLVFSIFVNAPLLELANFNETTNPSKAPWYFLGLQELLTMFHPMVAGVTIPGIGIFLLILAPYVDKNPEVVPEKRKFAIAIMTVHLLFWATLVIIGSFFRGPGFNFVFPWEAGLFFDF